MAPPRNLHRRRALADAAIEILGSAGIHALSHRAADERAGLPAGTASNYFPSRDGLLEAAARRVVELQLGDMRSANAQAPGPAGADELAALLASSLFTSATRHRTRLLAICELSLEATRRPALGQVLAELAGATLDVTAAGHRALGLATSSGQVQALITLFGGTLLALVTGPPAAVTRDGTLLLARCMVTGVLGTLPAAAPGAS